MMKNYKMISWVSAAVFILTCIVQPGICQVFAADGEDKEKTARAPEMKTDNPEAYLRRGGAYLKKGEYDLAVQDFNKAISLDSKNSIAYTGRASAYYKKELYEKAIADCNRSLEIYSGSPETYAVRGDAYRGMSEYDLSIKDFNKAIEIDPGEAKYYLGRSRALKAKGQIQAAGKDMKKVLELDPGNAKAGQELGVLEEKTDFETGIIPKEEPVVRVPVQEKAVQPRTGPVAVPKVEKTVSPRTNVAAAPESDVIEETEVEKKEISAAATEKTAVAPPGNFSGQDDVAPCILPISGKEPVDSGADWALGIGSKPGQLLDSLEGGRSGGDVTAMMVLLRQAGGPLSEDEDKAMNRKWAPYAASKSPRAHKAIRKQSELLLQSMVNRQIMVQSAWEYDFAIVQRQMAILMKDNEAAAAAEMMAELQQQVAENAKKKLDVLAEEVDKAPGIPTPEELKAEEDAERKNAEDALELGKGAQEASPSNKVQLGMMKFDKTFVSVMPPSPTFGAKVTKTCEVKDNSVSYLHSDKSYLVKYTCSWKPPDIIPVIDEGAYNKFGYWQTTRKAGTYPMFPFNIKLGDMGNKKTDIRIGICYSADGPDDPSGKSMIMYDTLLRPMKMVNNTQVYEEGQNFEIKELGYGREGLPVYKRDTKYVYICIQSYLQWTAYVRYKWEPFAQPKIVEATKQDPGLSADKNDQIAEHEANIAAAKKAIEGIRKEMGSETNQKRREEMRLQILHLDQDIHDSKDLIESIKTGSLVKTRGPWDEHATAVMARTTMELVEDCKRAQQMQASYVRLAKLMEKYKPDEARKIYESFRSQMVQGIYEPGGMEKARKSLDALYGSTTAEIKESQKQNYADLDVKKAQLERAEWNLAVAEGVKKNCDRAIFAGSMLTGMAPGLALSMVYEGACTSVEKGPREALKNAVVQGGIMLVSMGTVKAGGWAIGKFLNPKVAQSEVNTFKKILDSNRYQQEMEWNQALVNRLKEKATAMENFKPSRTGEYFKVSSELNDAVAAANSSSLAKNIMKNELIAAEKGLVDKGSKEAAAAFNEIKAYQDVLNKRLQTNIYPQTDNQMLIKLRQQGYNVEASWFREFRNATSRGVNRDRDLGLLAQMEGKLMKNGKTVPLNEFMSDGQKAYNTAYKQVTGRSAALADQSITTTAHSEAFPLKWLEQKIGDAGDPRDYEKAGTAIYNKVRNAMAGPDPAFVNLKKACGSLGKDLKTKVLPRLEKPVSGSAVSETSRKAATEHWSEVQKVMDNFASDKIDPLTAMRELQRLTGSTSITQSAAEVRRLMNRLGGAGK